MVDVVASDVRSRMMAGIRGRNTRPELLLRHLLHKSGFRFRLHSVRVFGRPDMVFPKYNAVLLVHGCFWHGHRCHLFRWPSTRIKFWKMKINKNRTRDRVVRRTLGQQGWRVMTVWECALKGRGKITEEQLTKQCSTWLRGNAQTAEIKGNAPRYST